MNRRKENAREEAGERSVESENQRAQHSVPFARAQAIDERVLLDAIEYLHAAGVKMAIGSSWYAKPQQVFNFAIDPDGYLKAHFGVTDAELRAWREARGHVRCAGVTRGGKRCNRIMSPHFENPGSWAQIVRVPHFCRQHRHQPEGDRS